MKILIIEDEIKLLRAIETFLLQEKYVVETAADFNTACQKALIYNYDCILLDINLPDGNGMNLLEKLKKEQKAANIIIISARHSLDDKVKGLDLGADDYLTKPFHLSELQARIKAVLRRKNQDGQDVMSIGNTKIDFNNRQVFAKEQPIKLNRKEFDILSYFAINKNRLMTKENIAEHVWGDNFDLADNFDFVYYQVKNLRKKLKENLSDIEIENSYGIGYKLVEN
jgi:DNA-binding response OmpR family regulator